MGGCPRQAYASALPPLQNAPDDTYLHVDSCWSDAALTSPFPEPQDIFCGDLCYAFLLKERGRFDQELPFLFLAGFTQLQLAPVEIAVNSLSKT